MDGESEVKRRGPFGSFVAVLRGIFWGVLVVGIALVALNQLTPMRKTPPATAAGDAATDPATPAPATPAPATPAPATPAPATPAPATPALPAPSETTAPAQPDTGTTTPSTTGVDEGAAIMPAPSGAVTNVVVATAGARIDLAGPAFDVNAQPFAAPAGTALVSVVLYGPEVSVIDAGTLGKMRMPLTLAIRPAAPESRALAVLARTKGHEVLVELPLAVEGVDGGIAAGAKPADLSNAILSTMADLDMAIGATAPNGAVALESLTTMAALTRTLAEFGFAWIEPHTGADSAGERLAGGSNLPFARADWVLKPDATNDEVFRALASAAELARILGSAIVFVPATRPGLAAVVRWDQDRAATDVQFAPVSAALRRRQAG